MTHFNPLLGDIGLNQTVAALDKNIYWKTLLFYTKLHYKYTTDTYFIRPCNKLLH